MHVDGLPKISCYANTDSNNLIKVKKKKKMFGSMEVHWHFCNMSIPSIT